MFIAITQDDWMKLPLATRRELKRFIADQFRAPEDEGSETERGQAPAMYDLNEHMMHRFMGGVSEKTKAFLKCFVRDGKAYVSELIEATGYEQKQDFRGVLGAISRRMRKLFGDPDAYMIDWKEDVEDGERGGHYYIKEGTRQALESYFNS
jgi:hypothetical protein